MDRSRIYHEVLKYHFGCQGSTVTWNPDFIDVSDCGTLGYSYGKYVWKIRNSEGAIVERKGIFYTVWKKQKDKSWRYVWD